MLLGIDKHVIFGRAAIAVYSAMRSVVLCLPLILTRKQCLAPVATHICMQIVYLRMCVLLKREVYLILLRLGAYVGTQCSWLWV